MQQDPNPLRRVLLTPVGSLFVLAYGLLVGLTIVGAVVTSRVESLLKPGGSFSDGLITSVFGVVISTILIAPLTAFFVNLRREHQLAPVKREYLRSIKVGVESLAARHVRFLDIFGTVAMGFDTGVSSALLMKAFASLSASLDKSFSSAPKHRAQFAEAEALRNEGASILHDLTASHCEEIYREITHLDNTLMFCIPLFPPEAVAILSAVREHTLEFRNHLNDLRYLLSGHSDPVALAGARQGVLDIGKIWSELQAIETSLPGGIIPDKHPTPGIAAMTRIGTAGQETLISHLVDVLEKELQLEAQIKPIRP
jgi:hypothetical protein